MRLQWITRTQKTKYRSTVKPALGFDCVGGILGLLDPNRTVRLFKPDVEVPLRLRQGKSLTVSESTSTNVGLLI